MDYLKALSAQRIVNIEASSRAILDQVIAGEYPMGLMMFNHHTVISAQKGAPSDWIAMEPVPVALDAVGILKDAPHPNAARLLVDFLTSEDGQRVLQQGRLSAGDAERAGDEDRPAAGGRRLQGDVPRPDEIYDRIPAGPRSWASCSGEALAERDAVAPLAVVPAKAGIQSQCAVCRGRRHRLHGVWVPAFAGTTARCAWRSSDIE